MGAVFPINDGRVTSLQMISATAEILHIHQKSQTPENISLTHHHIISIEI